MNKRTTIAVFFLMIVPVMQVAAQESEETKKKYYEEVDVAPEIKGGLIALAAAIVYPEAARKAEIEGIVIVEVRVSSRGNVDKVRAVRTDSEVLTASALEALRNISFNPGMKGGKAVPTIVMVPVKYKLK